MSDIELNSIEEAIEAIAAGKPVLVADDEDRENEGDVILSAELATPESLAFMIRYTSGLVCAPMTAEIADDLDLPPMVAINQDSKSTAYTVTVDAAAGVTTGISAADRARTLNVLADPESTEHSIIRPGHVLPLRAVAGGVRERSGHTEAAVELMQLAGLRPVAAIAEVVHDDGTMMRLPELVELGKQFEIPVVTIEQLIAYLDGRDPQPVSNDDHEMKRRVSRRADSLVPTEHGNLRFLAYKDRETGTDHLAILSGEITDGTLVRVHSECLTGEAFGSLKCECGPQLEASLDAISADGGIVIYMRGHEGRGIGLVNKLRAYSLQEQGLDTLDANLALGLPADARDYAAAAGMLHDLGVTSIRLLTNNSDKVAQLTKYGITVTEQVPLVVGVGPANHGYLSTKAARMGHTIGADQLSDALAADAIVQTDIDQDEPVGDKA